MDGFTQATRRASSPALLVARYPARGLGVRPAMSPAYGGSVAP